MAKRKQNESSSRKPVAGKAAGAYGHPQVDMALRPEIGTQAQFRKGKEPAAYRYDSSLSPALEWDALNPSREQGEALLAEQAARLAGIEEQVARLRAIPDAALGKDQRAELREAIAALKTALREGRDALDRLRRLSGPFLNWSGKAERLSFAVPTLPLFVHERLSTAAIIDTLTHHKRDLHTDFFSQLYGNPSLPVTDQALRAYQHREKWENRLILGDSLVVMNSLLRFESLGGQVQMVFMDPPYGIKFGSNFQPFVRKKEVSEGDDLDMTREPEMVQAYRDTWQLGIHSYLTYLRDRLLLVRELLTTSGSLFVQISDENLHHVRELIDEIFGPENFISIIPFRKKTMPLGAKHLESVTDYLLWVAKDKERLKFRNLFEFMSVEGDNHWNCVELASGTRRKMTKEEVNNHKLLPEGSTPYQLVSLYPAGVNQTGLFPFEFKGKVYRPKPGNSWFTNEEGMQRLAAANRLEPYEDGDTLRYVLKLTDSPVTTLTNLWSDTSAPSDKSYAVQTNVKVVQRCIIMATDPGDLVLDPTCGSGTTAYVAEAWGRRWISCDASRVPLALTRQRLLTATFPWYALTDEALGPTSGFRYSVKLNNRGQHVGGIIPYISKGSISNSEKPSEEILFDRPDVSNSITRVCGPFVFEATIPTAQGLDGTPEPAAGGEAAGNFVARMLEVLRKSPVLRLPGNRTVTFRQIRPPARSLSLSAEAFVEGGDDTPVAFLFGPDNGAVSTRLVESAAREAYGKHYGHLYVIGFAIEAKAREAVENCAEVFGLPATYVQATPDLMMGDLLKNMRSSQIFSVCGAPDVKLTRLPAKKDEKEEKWAVELRGLDVFDPVTMEVQHRRGEEVPAWFLDADYNGRVFHVAQAFFPRTGAWENLKKALKGDYDAGVWDHLAGTVSAPFTPGPNREIAVKVIDERGNELLVVRKVEG